MRRIPWMTFFFVLAGCGGSGGGPADVAEDFWQAARDGDAETIEALSVPSENTSIDPTKSASIESVTLGEAQVDGARATVATTVTGMSEQMPSVDFQTVLVEGDGAWRVDLEQTTDEMFKAITGVSMGAMVEEMGEAIAEGMGEAMQGVAEGMAEGMKDMAEAMGDAMSEAVSTGDTAGADPAPEPTALRPAVPSAGEIPWSPPRTGTVRPGMTLDEVVAAWGAPAHVREAGEWSYVYFRNGCERRCGTWDVLFLQDGQVVDAVVRTEAHQYAGVSSSPAGRPAAYTPPRRGDPSPGAPGARG